MFEHVSIGVRDLARSKIFYDAALKPLGIACKTRGEGYLGYGRDGIGLWILQARSPVPSDPESGLHFCIGAPTRAAVDGFHAGAIGAGGADNGPPGVRNDYGPDYYAAFVIDPDGYRLEAWCGKPA